ncbi:MAG: sugar porter family MFS transporter, partial [Proteobacteria bacterium]|nr:sugar porter family MFS transporter [Pseudomonadota bacterium]
MLLRLVALSALFGFLFGFDEGVIAGALPFIGKQFEISPASEGFMTAAVPLGAVAGAVLAAAWSDRFGRRRVLLACSVLFGVGSIICGVTPSIVVLTLARLLLGIAIGASSMAAPMFLAELAPAERRGAIVSAFQLMITVGILVSYLVGLALADSGHWRAMLTLGVVPAVVTFFGMISAAESPRWLVLQGRASEAAGVIRSLQPELGPAQVDRMVQEIEARSHASGEAPGWHAFLAPGVRGVTVFAMMAFLLQQVSGINAVIYYAPRILHSGGYGSTFEQLLGTVGIGAINVLMTFVAIATVDRLGRRPLFVFAFVGTAASLLVIAWAMGNGVPPVIGLIGLFAYIAVFAMSLGPLPWLYMSELFPLQLRSRGMALASVSNWSFNFLVVFLFPVATGWLGTMGTMLVFAGFCAAGAVYAVIWAPESKGESLEALETR